MSKEHRLKPQKKPTENKALPLSFLLGWSQQALLEHLPDQAAPWHRRSCFEKARVITNSD